MHKMCVYVVNHSDMLSFEYTHTGKLVMIKEAFDSQLSSKGVFLRTK